MSGTTQIKPLTILLMLLSASLLAGCSQVGRASDGSGYSVQTPNSKTRTFISNNDERFRDQVAAHNLQCSKDAGCRK